MIPARRAGMAPWGKLMFDNQLAIALEWLNDAVAIARRPVAQGPSLWAKWDATVTQTARSRFSFITATLPLLLVPSFRVAGAADSRVKGELVQLPSYWRPSGTGARRALGPPPYPPSTARSFRRAPIDVFSGQAFRIEHRDGQLFIYSIGPNRKDEHGAFDRKRYQNGGPDDFGTSGWDISLRGQPAPPAGESGK